MNAKIILFDSTPAARLAMKAKMAEYFDWCEQLSREAGDDESWNSFCEWYGNR